MQIVIYISCNISVGQGHLSRCLNLANTLKGNIISFTGNIDDFGINLIKNYGYDVGDVEFADLSIIDDYGINLEQEIEIAKKSGKIMVIDDAPNRPHYCDILLDQNYVSKNNEYLPLMQKDGTQFLLGPEYLLLAPEYFEPFERITKQKPERCLVFFTGGDCQGMTLKAIEAIKDCDFATDVVIGINNPYKEQIVAEVDKYPQITLHIQTTKMRELIDNADFSIGEFGFSTWERLARKLPMIGIITSDYQEKLENYFVKNDLVISLGWREKITIDDIKNSIEDIKNIDLSGYKSVGGSIKIKKLIVKILQQKQISILTNKNSWINQYLPDFMIKIEKLGYNPQIYYSKNDLPTGDILFLLSCEEIVGKDILTKYKNNIVVHESDLPQGKGWSPMTWQILEGKNIIPICLFEATEEVDSGIIYIKDYIELTGYELINEWHDLLGNKTVEMCLRFINEYPSILNEGKTQIGLESFYSKRTHKDSELNINKSILDNFNLFRVVDNDKYPAYFIINGHKYKIKIDKYD